MAQTIQNINDAPVIYKIQCSTIKIQLSNGYNLIFLCLFQHKGSKIQSQFAVYSWQLSIIKVCNKPSDSATIDRHLRMSSLRLEPIGFHRWRNGEIYLDRFLGYVTPDSYRGRSK